MRACTRARNIYYARMRARAHTLTGENGWLHGYTVTHRCIYNYFQLVRCVTAM